MSKIFSMTSTSQLVGIDSNTEPNKTLKSPTTARHIIHNNSLEYHWPDLI